MRGAARFLLGGALALSLASCAGAAGGGGQATADCSAEPGRPVTVFLEGRSAEDPRAVRFEGVTFAGPVSEGGAAVPRYTFTDRERASRRLAFFDPGGPLPVVSGRAYDLTLEMVMGEPSPGAILLSDGAGLLLAAASDTRAGRSVLADGPPGFTVRVLDGGCRSRPVTPCFVERVNAVLEVVHDGASVRLTHGQRARLGAYEVLCHAAERVKYSPKCADAGVLAVSWSIRRVESPRPASGGP